MLWLVEFRKHLPLFVAIYVVTVGLGLTQIALPGVLLVQMLQGFGGMLCWAASVVYSASVLFRYITLRRDLLLHIGTISTRYVTWVKVCVLFAFMAVQLLCGLAVAAHQIVLDAAPHAGAAFAYLGMGKLLSIAAYLAVVTAAAIVLKPIRSAGVATVVFAVTLVVVTTLQAILLWRLGAPDTTNFFIGIGGDEYTVHLYAGILPLILTGPADGYLPAPLVMTSTLLNAGWAACCGLALVFPRAR